MLKKELLKNISPEECTPLVDMLLAVIEQQSKQIEQLDSAIKRLKKLNQKPEIKPSQLEKDKDNDQDDDKSSGGKGGGKRAGSSKKSKKKKLNVDESKRLINPMLLIYRKCFILLAGTLLNSTGVIFRNLQLFGSAGSLLEYAHSNDTVLGHVFSPFVLN